MSLRMNVQIIGGRELEKALRELGTAAGQRGGPVKAALMAATLPVLKSARNKAPKSTSGSSLNWGYRKGKLTIVGPKKAAPGRLIRAIKRRREPNPIFMAEIIGVGVDLGNSRNDPKGAWYGRIVEFQGGRGGVGKAFLRSALEENKLKSTRIYGRKLGAGIERIAKKIGNKNAQAVGAKAKSAASWTDRVVSGPVQKPFTYRGPLKS